MQSLKQIELLSLWEVGHRWAGFDPNDTADPAYLPAAVADRIRELLNAFEYHLNLYNVDGDYEEDFVIPLLWCPRIQNKALKRVRRYIATGTLPKEDLQTFFVKREEIHDHCRITRQPLPIFWFDSSSIDAHKNYLKEFEEFLHHPLGTEIEVRNTALRPDQRDKLTCQAIARRLWEIDPRMRIAAMMRREEIQFGGNGKLYTPKTLRRWLSEVAPKAVSTRRGRPRKDEI